MADITFDFRGSFQISEGFDIFQNDYNPMSYLNDNEPVYGLEDPVQYVGSESTFLDGQIVSDKVINGANNERGSYLAPGSAVSITPSSSASSLEHNATAEALQVPPSFNGDTRIYDDQRNFTLPSNALLTPPLLSSTSALEHLAQAMDVDSTPFFSSPPSTPDTLEREDDPESDSDSDLESDEAQVESDRDEYEEEIAQITASYRIKPMAQLKDVDVIRSQSSESRYSSPEPDVESTLSDDETDDAGDLAPPNDISNRPILHPHSRPVAIRGSPTPVASTSFVHAHAEVAPPEDEPISDPESEDDGVDSDYSPGHSSRRVGRKNRAPTRKAPKPKASPLPESQDTVPTATKIVYPAKIVSKKRYKGASRRDGVKRRKLADRTTSVVNNPDTAQAPHRTKGTAKTTSPAPESHESCSSHEKKVGDFDTAFDLSSLEVYEVKLSDVSGVCRIRLGKSMGATVELTDNAWAAVVGKVQKLAFNRPGLVKAIKKQFDERLDKVVEKTPNQEERTFACAFPECEYKCVQKKELSKHYAVHIPAQYFCPHCFKLFGRESSLKRHFTSKKANKTQEECSKVAAEHHYFSYREILNLFYLGFYENFDILDAIFDVLARRSRIRIQGAPVFNFASNPPASSKPPVSSNPPA